MQQYHRQIRAGIDSLHVGRLACTADRPISLSSGRLTTWLNADEAKALAQALLEATGSPLADLYTETQPSAGVFMCFAIGQHVRHRDHNGQRVTGTVRGIAIDGDGVLQADIALDAPIVIPARGDGDREVNLWWQHVPAHELTPFDARDDLIARLQQQVVELTAHRIAQEA